MSCGGKDGSQGIVQVAFVSCAPETRVSDYGWAPVPSATIEVYVDGQRYFLVLGDYHDGVAARRGVHIVTDASVQVAHPSHNTVSLWLDPPTPPAP